MRLGIIGTGKIVQEILPVLTKMKDLEIIAIQGTERSFDQTKRLCERYGVPYALKNSDDLCAAEIDTVYVAVPNYLHFSYCKKLLEKGFHVIVEKPMTSNYNEALILSRLAKEKGRILFEAVTTLYLQNFKKIKEWLPRIGQIKIVQSQYSQYSSRYDAFKAGETPPVFDQTKSGGALMDLNLYNIHLVMGLFGAPGSVRYYANMERDIDTSGILMMEYPGFKALCLAAKDSPGVSSTIIQGTDGYIQTFLPPNAIGKIKVELRDGMSEEFEEETMESRMIPEFLAFINAINENHQDFAYKMLDKSIAVSRVQTEARLYTGIYFASDASVAEHP